MMCRVPPYCSLAKLREFVNVERRRETGQKLTLELFKIGIAVVIFLMQSGFVRLCLSMVLGLLMGCVGLWETLQLKKLEKAEMFCCSEVDDDAVDCVTSMFEILTRINGMISVGMVGGIFIIYLVLCNVCMGVVLVFLCCKNVFVSEVKKNANIFPVEAPTGDDAEFGIPPAADATQEDRMTDEASVFGDENSADEDLSLRLESLTLMSRLYSDEHEADDENRHLLNVDFTGPLIFEERSIFPVQNAAMSYSLLLCSLPSRTR